MKSLSALSAMLLLAAGCATIHHEDSSRFQVIAVPQGLQDPAKMDDMRKSISQGETVVLKVAQGERMPFRLKLDLPMGSLERSESTFVFTRDTYFLLSRKKFYVSPDGQRWASVDSRRALKTLFGFKHGEFSFGFSSSTNEATFMNVELKTK